MSLRALANQFQRAPEGVPLHREQYLRLIEKENKGSNALLQVCAERSGSAPSDVNSPLFGLQYVVKGNIAVGGLPLSFGLKTPVKASSDEDAAVVKKIDTLGGELLGIANLDPMCLGHGGGIPDLGRVVNLQQPEMMVGGSSSGSAVAVASSYCDFALGTDCGGSVRTPAVLNGLCALKLSSDSVDTDGMLLYKTKLDAPGIIARTIDDLSFLCDALLPSQRESSTEIVQLIRPEFGADCGYSAQILKGFDDLAAAASSLYETTTESFENNFKEIEQRRKCIMAAAMQQLVADLELDVGTLPDEARALLHLYSSGSSGPGGNSTPMVSAIQEALHSSQSVFFTPVMPCEVPVLRSDGDKLAPNALITFANLFDLPAMVFTLRTPDGFHLPVQVIGSHGAEIDVIQTAQRLEKCLSGKN